MTIGVLVRGADIHKRLLESGLSIHSGPFKFLIRSNISTIAQNLSILYSDFSGFDGGDSSAFYDFHVSIKPPNLLRRLFYKQSQFYLDDKVVFNPFPLHHATAMLEWGMNWCISSQIHTYLIVHAAVIERNGLAAVLPAPPGSGKSTLCACLVMEGWRLLSDELTLIDLDSFDVVPMPRPIGLKNRSIDVVKQRYPDAVLGIVSSDTVKGSISHLKPPSASVGTQQKTCPVGWIIFPKFENGAATELTPRSKGQTFMEIADNSFNYSHLGVIGFNVLKSVVDDARCFNFKYSDIEEAVDVFFNLSECHAV